VSPFSIIADRQHTVDEIAANFGGHPHQVVQWKKQALEALPDAFSRRRVREAQGEDAFKAQLYQQSG
jgi:transposase-like protein